MVTRLLAVTLCMYQPQALWQSMATTGNAFVYWKALLVCQTGVRCLVAVNTSGNCWLVPGSFRPSQAMMALTLSQSSIFKHVRAVKWIFAHKTQDVGLGPAHSKLLHTCFFYSTDMCDLWLCWIWNTLITSRVGMCVHTSSVSIIALSKFNVFRCIKKK